MDEKKACRERSSPAATASSSKQQQAAAASVSSSSKQQQHRSAAAAARAYGCGVTSPRNDMGLRMQMLGICDVTSNKYVCCACRMWFQTHFIPNLRLTFCRNLGFMLH
jgi:hypothetical protein